MKKILVILCTIILLAVCIIFICINNDTSNNANAENIEEKKEITFTKTYRVVDILEYQDTIDEFNYIVLDKFQEFNPYIVKIKKELATDLHENCFYEFTFKGVYKENFDYSNIRELFNEFDIVNIVLTNKTGLDQIQETPQ